MGKCGLCPQFSEGGMHHPVEAGLREGRPDLWQGLGKKRVKAYQDPVVQGTVLTSPHNASITAPLTPVTHRVI